MSLTEQQISTITATERVCSSISLISASTAVLTFLSRSDFRKPINRLIFYALLGNIMLNVATLISYSAIQHGTGSPLCQFQAFLVQWFFPADALWALCIACNVYLIVFCRYNAKQLRRLEWKYALLCYFLPFIPAFILLFIQTPDRGRVYGSATFECWISPSWNPLRIAVLFGPVWLIIIVIFTIYSRLGLYIYFQSKLLRGFRFAGDWTANSSSTENYVIRTTPSPYQDHIQADESDIVGQRTVSGRLSNPQMGISEISRVRSDLNMATWAYLRYAFLFFIALLVTWVCCSFCTIPFILLTDDVSQVAPSVNRLRTLVDPQYVSFGLNYANAFVIPLQGLWNSVIYLTISRREFKSEFKALLGQ
ncbi:hypothetical protein N7486_004122 [Penicillium sp. IBT 16267x]|nr:hypothetical protein N7486_004122 [Penicillium sp. IBT 16267x]